MLESTEDVAEAPPLMKKLSAAASSCQSAALSSSMASDSLAHRQASAQRVIRRESDEDPPLLGSMVVVVVQTDARVHTPGAGEGDEVPHLFLLGFFQRVHGRTRRARESALRSGRLLRWAGCSGKSFMFTTLRTKQDEPPGKLTDEHFE